MRTLKGFWPVLAALLLMVSFAHADGHVLEVGTYVLPPLSVLDESGRLGGESLDLLSRALAEMGYVPEYRILPMKRCLEGMLHGELAMMLPVVKTAERSTYMLFSEPVVRLESVFWKRDSARVRCWETPEDLVGHRIGIALGYVYGPELQRLKREYKLNLTELGGKNPEKTLFLMLEAGRMDLILCDRSIGEYIKARNRPLFDDIVPCPRPVGQSISLNYPISKEYFDKHKLDADAFLSRLNESLTAAAAVDPAR
ncbi:transporter substrate-binding domain-containing protein [Pseudodesulfovibrio indicus]|uniref:substrate-binding periplasmic protein n=1 Tax=Pseudodesulfovibrio indicus TaxID=1716143 RepID=UPI00292E64A2|nr:transporter substrate-binding domain-containing protein [Pseudodesulfovibrio indicus]